MADISDHPRETFRISMLYQRPEYLTHLFGFNFWETLNQ